MNNSGDTWENDFDLDDIEPPPPPLSFISGPGTYSYVETEFGKGLEINCNGSFYLEAVKYDRQPYGWYEQETFLSLHNNQSGERTRNGTLFHFHVYFEGDENLTQVTLKSYHASLGYYGSTNHFQGYNQLLVNGWNEVSIYWGRRS